MFCPSIYLGQPQLNIYICAILGASFVIIYFLYFQFHTDRMDIKRILYIYIEVHNEKGGGRYLKRPVSEVIPQRWFSCTLFHWGSKKNWCSTWHLLPCSTRIGLFDFKISGIKLKMHIYIYIYKLVVLQITYSESAKMPLTLAEKAEMYPKCESLSRSNGHSSSGDSFESVSISIIPSLDWLN